MNAVRGALERLLRGDLQGGDDIALAVLVLAALLSLVHFLTMLVTRWGDRHTAFKSFVASLLVHCVCLFSFQIFTPLISAENGELERVPSEPDLVIDVLPRDVSESATAEPDPESVPLADRPNQLMPELKRLEQPEPEREAGVMPERESGRQGPLSTNAPTVSQFETRPMEPLEAPRESTTAAAAPKAADPAAELETIFESSLADLATAASPRMAVESSGLPERSDRVEPAGPREAPELEFSAEAPSIPIATSPATSPDSAMLALPELSTEEASSIRRRPSPSALPLAAVPDPVAAGGEMSSSDVAASLGIRSRLPRPERPVSERAEIAMPERFRGGGEIGIGGPISRRDARGLPVPRVATGVGAAGALSSAEELLERDMQLQPNLRGGPPEVYQLRSPGRRRAAALEYGGTPESEVAVERSLQWLASVQSADGHWDASDFGSGLVERDENGTNREFAGREADTGVTGLAILCYLGAGYTHEQGPYASVVDRGLDWLLRQQGRDGNLFGRAELFAQMYCHAIATYAIGEACGLVRPARPESALGADGLTLGLSEDAERQERLVTEERLRRSLALAVRFILSRQDAASGGWRYEPGQSGDMSMLGWQLMALKSAELAGIPVPGRVRTAIEGFMSRAAQGESGGLFGYLPMQAEGDASARRVTPAMTAEALFSRQVLGVRKDAPGVLEAVRYLGRNGPALSEKNFYYWYYGSLAMYQQGGREWDLWNERVRELLISEQVSTGPYAGTWDATDLWGRYGGRLYSTTFATLTLEVYYRFLPLHRDGALLQDRGTGGSER
jgi:hypothetical protein